MKELSKPLIVFSLCAFFLSWGIMYSIMEAAQGVGDADMKFSPTTKSLKIASIIGVLTFAITGLIRLVWKKMIK